MSEEFPLLHVDDLSVSYRRRRKEFVAVQGVSFDVDRGRTLGLVGESGSGKSSIGSVLLGLTPAATGQVLLDGVPVDRSSRAASAALARRVQAVFQDPYGSMDPSRKIGNTLAEALRYTVRLNRDDAAQRIRGVLAEVGMDESVLQRYPAQFSGGQLQRLAIARALVVEPDLIVCDEAVSALDLSVQAQVINLFERLAASRGLSYLFISHDLSVVAHMSDEIMVLYAGQVMERGPAQAVAQRPRHPYTQNLVLSAPVPDPGAQAKRRAARTRRTGEDTASADVTVAQKDPRLSPGCPYADRCPFVIDKCRRERPALRDRAGIGSLVACHRDGDLEPVAAPPAGGSEQVGR